ncbi:DsbA family oxidoreductase [Nocardiopsis alba]|uniref:DsbA family oxidoreductase n=1 Tax=Nocardiopsis alba TaxID=53437 RepID=UPI0033C331B6
MTPTVWADVRCPWCWMGHRSLAAALERRDRREPVVRASYLLDPHGEGHPGRTVRGVALASWGMDEDGWRAMRDRVETAGRAFGLRIRMDGVPAIDSRPAHRLLKLAQARGVDPEHAWDLAFSALLEHNRDLGDPEVLRDLAVEMGLTAEDTDPLWSSTAFAAEVDADHRAAVEAGVRAVPTFAVGDRTLSGARSVDELVELLRVGAEEVGR